MLKAVSTIIQEAGDISLDYFARLSSLKVSPKKGPKDLVSEADIAVEAFLKEKLLNKYPEYGFWGEESGRTDGKAGLWVVDPIDGTHSFLRGQYFWSISIALITGQETRIGLVYAPVFKDLYAAEKGKGARQNNQPISVSSIDQLADAMVCTGFACLRDNLRENNLDRFARIALRTRDQRRFGSAALDLCLVAAGQLDAFWEQHLNLYDVAAGALIVEEAGGMVCDFGGSPGLDPEEVLATNGRIHDEILTLM